MRYILITAVFISIAHANVIKECPMTGPPNENALSDSITMMVGGWTEDPQKSYSLVDPSFSCTFDLAPLPAPNMWDPVVHVVRDHMFACFIDYEDYIARGRVEAHCWTTKLGASNPWNPVLPPPQAMFLTASAVVGDKVLVIGGSESYHHDIDTMSGSTLVQEYNAVTKIWSNGTNLPAPLFEGCAVSIDTGVLVIGDFEAGSPNAYILNSSKWAPLPLSNYAHTNPGCGLVTINAKTGVLVISGKFVELFLLEDRQWVKLPHPVVNRKHDIKPTVGMSHGQVVIAGGFDMDRGEVSDAIEVWDEEEERWRMTSKRMRGNRMRQSDVVLPAKYAYNCFKNDVYKRNHI